jgi:hypothetical protein
MIVANGNKRWTKIVDYLRLCYGREIAVESDEKFALFTIPGDLSE